MKQIERYIFVRIAAITLWSVSLITILVLTTQILVRVDILTTSSRAIMTFLSLAITLVPEVFLVIAPFALLIGIGRILTTMNEDSELVVIEASGASNKFIIRPVLYFSTLIGIMLLIVSNFIGPLASRNLYSIIANANSDIISIALNSGNFHRIEDDLYIQISEILPGGKMGGIFVSDRRDPLSELIYYAKSGTIVKDKNVDLLLMREGEIYHDEGQEKNPSIVSFTSYAFDLKSFIPSQQSSPLRPVELYLTQLLNPDTVVNSNQDWEKTYPSHIHSRLSNWLYPIVFGVIMVAFLGRARSRRTGQVHQVFTAVLVSAVIKLSGGYAIKLTETTNLAIFGVYLIPIVAILYFGLIILRGRTIKLPRFWLQMGGDLILFFTSVIHRYANRKTVMSINKRHGRQ